MSHPFVDALKNNDLDAVKALPKTDLHDHSILGARVERVEAWKARSIPRPPDKMNVVRGMMDCAGSTLYPYIHSQEGFEFTADAAIQDAIEDGVSLLETSVDVKFAFLYSGRVYGLHQFLSSLLDRYQDRITVHVEIGFSRGDSEERLDMAYQCIETAFYTGIDLYGDQTLICLKMRSRLSRKQGE